MIGYYAPYISGLTEYARLVAEALAARSCDITVLTSRHRNDLPAKETVQGVHIVRAKPWLTLHKGIMSVDFIRQYRRLVRGADIVHLHLPMLESGLLARMTPRAVPLAVTYQCDLAPARRWSPIDRMAVAAVRASGRFCCARAQRILVLSQDYAAGSPVLGRFLNKCIEVYPPDKAVEGQPPREANPAGPKTVGFLGRFVEEKGIDVILNAIPLVLAKFPDTRFILAGDYESVRGGSPIKRWRARLDSLRPNVITPGKLPEEGLFDFYRSLDLFLLPSINAYEAFGIVQIEAMKAGVPVIASDLRGVRQPVRLTGCGTVVPAGDPQALAAAITAWVSGEKQLAPREIAARAWATFSNRRTVDKIQELYATLAPADAEPVAVAKEGGSLA